MHLIKLTRKYERWVEVEKGNFQKKKMKSEHFLNIICDDFFFVAKLVSLFCTLLNSPKDGETTSRELALFFFKLYSILLTTQKSSRKLLLMERVSHESATSQPLLSEKVGQPPHCIKMSQLTPVPNFNSMSRQS